MSRQLLDLSEKDSWSESDLFLIGQMFGRYGNRKRLIDGMEENGGGMYKQSFTGRLR